jgi:acyl transferase domain-containing protein
VKGSHLHELLGSSIPTPLPQRIFQRQLSAADPPYLAEHRVQDSTAFPAAGYIELSLAGVAPGDVNIRMICYREKVPYQSGMHKVTHIAVMPPGNSYSTYFHSLNDLHISSGLWLQNLSARPTANQRRLLKSTARIIKTITYSGPDQETYSLSPEMASVWVDGVQLIDEYVFARGVDGGGPIRGGGLVTDSNDPSNCSFDLDNYTIFEGAHVLA